MFKRSLEKSYPHLGMSTPDILNKHSFLFFENLKYQFRLHKEVISQNGVYLYFGLYVCPSVELDFKAPDSFAEDEVKGELELF